MNFATGVRFSVVLVFRINRSLSAAQVAWFFWRTLTSTQDNIKYHFEDKVIYFENSVFISAQIVAVYHLRCK
jgi:hypothetical protein